MRLWVLGIASLIVLGACSGEGSEPSCEDVSQSVVDLFNDNLKKSADPIKSMSAVKSEDYPGGDASLFTNKSAWFVAGGDAIWVTGMDPSGSGQEGPTAPMNEAARSASSIGVDVPSGAFGSLESDCAYEAVQACS